MLPKKKGFAILPTATPAIKTRFHDAENFGSYVWEPDCTAEITRPRNQRR